MEKIVIFRFYPSGRFGICCSSENWLISSIRLIKSLSMSWFSIFFYFYSGWSGFGSVFFGFGLPTKSFTYSLLGSSSESELKLIFYSLLVGFFWSFPTLSDTSWTSFFNCWITLSLSAGLSLPSFVRFQNLIVSLVISFGFAVVLSSCWI